MSEDTEYKVIVVDECVEVGAVRCPSESNYCVLRQEIEADELVIFPFEFVTRQGNVVREKQEGKWLVQENEVHIKRKFPFMSSTTNKRQAQAIVVAGSEDIEYQDMENDGLVEEGEKSTQAGNKLESKLLPFKVLKSWQSEMLRVKHKLQGMGRYDEFELYTVDMDGRPWVKLWCNECGDTYGSGSVSNAHDTLGNFYRFHVHTTAHLKEYVANHGDVKVFSDWLIGVSFKQEVERAIDEMEMFNNKNECSSFQVVEATLSNARSKYSVRMRCTMDGKWLPLVPKSKGTLGIMIEHLKSRAHITACMMSKHQNTHGHSPTSSLDILDSYMYGQIQNQLIVSSERNHTEVAGSSITRSENCQYTINK
ncbi:hypothetical protein O6H91_08G023800 [Diphasiastrum complanatum]|nr:hypothetical protein O6H91_08G023800 [Diphasiastrum complanatum]KAJ7546079.1 hypothetical protein O6H91_08G023800 [Diphasiastrum complanatum]